MTIYVHAADDWGCGYHRVIYPAEVLIARGHNVKIIRPGTPSGMSSQLRGGHPISVTCPDDAETIVLQRPCNRHMAESIPLLRARGVHVVVDMDDDLAHIDPNNPAFWQLHPSKNDMVNWAHAAYACREASLVTVSTPSLAAVYGAHGRVRVLENCVPAVWLDVPRVDADWLAWAGALHSHPGDLDDAVGAIQHFVRAGVGFRVIGDGLGVAKKLGLPDVLATGVVAFDDWAAQVARVGVGIAPLADTRFNIAKSWLRGLTYSALGVPWVGSDLPEQARLAALGAGAVCHRRDWQKKLRPLVSSVDARDEASEKGRAVVADWTYEARADAWLDAWTAP